MGEGVIEATIINWLKNEGDSIQEDDTILEVATDKVDTEIQSPVSGVIKKINFNKDDVVPVGEILVLIEIEGESEEDTSIDENQNQPIATETQVNNEPAEIKTNDKLVSFTDLKLTPLVRKMVKENNISEDELKSIKGSGINEKITKRDIEQLLENRGKTKNIQPAPTVFNDSKYNIRYENDEIVEMDRMRKLISQHMLDSKRISPHVTSIVETDLTDLVKWRNKVKDIFFNKYNQKITFMPIFVQAVVKALKDFPYVNASVEGTNIILRKNINIGIATALPNGNLIVPVLKNADQLNLQGITMKLNELINKARNNNLAPDEIQGGTFTITNLGTMGNIIGTPIINQPQVAILAVGAIVKKPAVLETSAGDVIAIRNKMYLSMSYDHRVVDGFLGGSFLKRVSDYLENFNTDQSF
ncbi:MAG: dihydrolipoamide acetyltransferase family protein [Saprospiraceae bacterium]